jgi:Peptide N-acetyl-beta-D-glucosaminyl asparaginase amidase A
VRKNTPSKYGFLNARLLLGFTIGSVGALLAVLGFAGISPPGGANYSLPAVPLSPDATPTPTPNPFDLPQVTAEAPPRVPATASCTEQVLSHTFANSYYAPGFGQHLAATCPGPWAAVILNIDVSVSGVQFDRIFDVYAGPVLIFASSTSEPASVLPNAVTHWHVDTDISRFAGLLATDQPITAILNNVNNSTYTGQYQVTLSLTFYATGQDAPAAKVPDVIVPVLPANTSSPNLPGNYGGDGYAVLNANTSSYEQGVTLPRNLLSLQADVYAQGHGACEEFWWAAPSQCGVGTPLRQVTIAIDGVLAGIAPVYPVLFTGGGGPGSWNPIPSPRAWHVDPYRLDLSAFVGLLVDGQPHQITLAVPDAAYSDPGDFWLVGATLLGKTDPGMTQTSGALTSPPVAGAATETTMGDPTITGAIIFTATRSGTWTGYVVGSAGRRDTVVNNSFDLTTVSGIALTDSTWHWTTASQLTNTGGAPITTAVARTYLLDAPPAGGGEFEDAATTTVDGPSPFTSDFELDLQTAGAVEANVTQVETFQATDSNGYCYHRVINAAGGYVTSDQQGLPCVSTPTPTPSPTPTPGPVQLNGVVSRMAHNGAGTFDVDFPLTGTRGVECRSGGANGDYTIIFTFANSLVSVDSATVSCGSVAGINSGIGPYSNQFTISLTTGNVCNAQYITVTLNNVNDSTGNHSGIISSPEMGFLLGDVDATGRVDGNDVSAVQSHTRQTTDGTNYRYDVDVTGRIDGNDVSTTQGQTRTSLP